MTDGSGSSPNKKMRTNREREDLFKMPREELVDRIVKQQQEIDSLLAKQTNESSLDDLRETVERLKGQVAESARQENMLVMRLADKEQEVQDLLTQLHELKQAQTPSSIQLQSMLLDPAVNLLFIQMKRQVESSRNQLEQSQNDLAAWKFTPDSQTGKRLMAKCRMLLQENEDLGRMVSSGRLAKMEGDIALHKKLILEMKNSEKDTEDFLGDADEDLEAMQSTVYLLQQELKEAKERISKQLMEINELRSAAIGSQMNGAELSVSHSQSQSNSHDAVNSPVRTDGVLGSKNDVVNVTIKEEKEISDNSEKQPPADACSKHSVVSMDIEADSTTGVSSASCKNTADHVRTKSNSDRLVELVEDTNGRTAPVDRCRTASGKEKIEPDESLPNGVLVGQVFKGVD